MLRVFLNARRPPAPYKSAKFFFSFLKLRRRANFGLLAGKSARFSRYKSFFARMLIFRKFVIWFYGLKVNRRFRRLFQSLRQKSFASRYGTFLVFFSRLEMLVSVVVYRLGFSPNLAMAIRLVQNGFIFIDGQCQRNTFFVVGFGSIVESVFSLTTRFWVLFLLARSSLALFQHWVGKKRFCAILRFFRPTLWGSRVLRRVPQYFGVLPSFSELTPLLYLQRVF